MTDPNADVDDLAAEIDIALDAPQPPDGGGERTRYAGTVTTGPEPYQGRLIVSRYPSGILLVDKPGGRAWLLDRNPTDGTYAARVPGGAPIDPAGRVAAAAGSTYDVRAFDDDFDGDELPDPGPGAGATV